VHFGTTMRTNGVRQGIGVYFGTTKQKDAS
jgi:hypothetical protein